MIKDEFRIDVDYRIIQEGSEYVWQGLGEYEVAKARSRRGFATEALAIADAESSLGCLEELKASEQRSQPVI